VRHAGATPARRGHRPARDLLRNGPIGAVLRFDALGLAPAAGLRLALVGGLAAVVPGLVGLRSLVPSSAIGALLCGVVALLSPARVRARATALGSVLFAAVSLVGSLTFSHPLVYVAGLVVLAFVAGLLAQRGPPVSVLAQQSAVVYVTLGQTVAASAGSVGDHLAAFGAVGFGGLLQWLGVVLDPFRFRYAEHRRAVAIAYRRMADHLDAVARGVMHQLPGRPHARVATLALDASTRPSTRVLVVAAEAERLRALVASLDALTRAEVPAPADRRRLLAAAVRLREVARGVAPGDGVSGRRANRRSNRREPSPPGGESVPADASAPAGATGAADATGSAGPPGTDLGPALDRLESHLGSAERALAAARAGGRGAARPVGLHPGSPERARPDGRGPVRRRPAPRRPARRVVRWLAGLPARRHPWRLAIAVLLADGASRLVPTHHSYWVTFTALLVLRPDYAATSQRALARILGTVVGAATGLGIVLAHPGPVALVAVATVAGFVMFTTFGANYALFSVGITVTVSIILDAGGRLSEATLGERVLDIAIGSLIALAVIRVWPTRVSESIGRLLADAVSAEGRFAAAALRAVVGRGSGDTVLPGLVAARSARLAATAAVAQGATEPRGWRDGWWVPAQASVRALAGIGTSGLRIWSVDALPGLSPGARAAAVELADAVDRVAGALADRLCGNRVGPVGEVVDLAERMDVLAAAAGSRPPGSRTGGRRAAEEGHVRSDTDLVLRESAHIVDALGRVATAAADLVEPGGPGGLSPRAGAGRPAAG